MAKFPLARQDLNYKLASDYLNGKSAWLDDYVLENNSHIKEVKFTYMAKIIVYNPNSLSTVFRIVVTPNRQLSSIKDPTIKYSYNACVREYAMVLPSIETISILHNLAILPTALDLRDGYKSLKNSLPTALSCLGHFYRSKEGNPCISEMELDGTELQFLVPLYSSYGFSDLPMLFQYAVSQVVDVYDENYMGKLQNF